MDLAAALHVAPQVKSVSVVKERCTRYRHIASTCSRCEEICPTAALSLSANYPVMDATRCAECGACASVCPTEAIEAIAPSEQELSDSIAAQARQSSSVMLACKHAEDVPHEALRVGCLARLDLSMLLLAAGEGAAQVRLLTGECGACAAGSSLPYLRNIVSATQSLAEAFGAATKMSVLSVSPRPALTGEEQDVDLSRRAFFTNIGKGVRGRAGEALNQESLGHADDGLKPANLVPHLPQKRIRLIESLRTLAAHATGQMADVVRFSGPRLDAQKCIGCSMCADLCPTGALSATEEANVIRITCDAANCVACHLCVDACHNQAISFGQGEEGTLGSPGVTVLEMRSSADLLAPVEDKMSRLLGSSLYRT
jgi:ferredoxin